MITICTNSINISIATVTAYFVVVTFCVFSVLCILVVVNLDCMFVLIPRRVLLLCLFWLSCFAFVTIYVVFVLLLLVIVDILMLCYYEIQAGCTDR